MDDKSLVIRVPRRWMRVAMIVGLTALVVAPLAAVASHTFNDVPDTHTFHNDITWLADAGVTKGCNPPSNTSFCPDDEVTRGQMAAFIRRLAEGRVVDAGTVDGQEASALTTRVWADSCGVEAVGNPPEAETSCLPSSGGVIPGGVVSQVFSVQINAPAAGALQLSSSSLSDETIAWSFTMDQTCSAGAGTFINRAVNGHVWGALSGASAASHFTTNVSAGDHTLRLCGLNSSDMPTELQTASLTAQWTQGGSVNVAAGNTGSPVDLTGVFGSDASSG